MGRVRTVTGALTAEKNLVDQQGISDGPVLLATVPSHEGAKRRFLPPPLPTRFKSDRTHTIPGGSTNSAQLTPPSYVCPLLFGICRRTAA